MRIGYAIRDHHGHAWLKTRMRVEGVETPVTVWVRDEGEAMTFRRLPEARRMLATVRAGSRHPEQINILSPRWKAVG